MRIFNLTRIFQVGLVQPPWILFYDLQMFAMKCIFCLIWFYCRYPEWIVETGWSKRSDRIQSSGDAFFPTCQVRVVRFYVSRVLLLPLPSPSPPPPSPPQWAATSSVPYRTSTASSHIQCSLPDLNRDPLSPVFPAGPQPRDRMSEDMSERYKVSICLRQYCWTVWQSTGLFFFSVENPQS